MGTAKAKSATAAQVGASKTAVKPAASKEPLKVGTAKVKSAVSSKVGAMKAKSTAALNAGASKASTLKSKAEPGLKKGMKGKTTKKKGPWSAKQKSAACSIQARFRGFKARKGSEKKKRDKAIMKKK